MSFQKPNRARQPRKSVVPQKFTDGTFDKELEDLEGLYLASGPFRKRLQDVLANWLEKSRTATDSALEYERPNWDRKQADGVGYRRALRELVKLLSEKGEDSGR